MQTDKLFYEYFQLVPQAFFELLQIEPACPYRFTAPTLKASEKRLDGFLAPDVLTEPYYFFEIQGYLDRAIYWRLVSQISRYHEQYPDRQGQTWQAAILFLDATFDPGPETLGPLYQPGSQWLVRDTLGGLLARVANPSPVLNVLKPLIIPNEAELRREAPIWAQTIRSLPDTPAPISTKLLDILVKFIVQRFTTMSWKEIETMLMLTPIEETVAGQDLIRKGKEQGLQEGWQQGLEQGFQQGKQQSMQSNIIDLLEVRFGPVPDEIIEAIDGINHLPRLRTLLRQTARVASLAAFAELLESNKSS